MLKSNRFLFLWCALIGGIIFVAILPGNNWIYKLIADYDSSRWLHFLAYGAVVAVPFATSKYKRGFLFAFIPPIVCIALESSHANVPGAAVRSQNIPADLFGIAAGVLLGLDLRVLSNSEKPLNTPGSASPGHGPY